MMIDLKTGHPSSCHYPREILAEACKKLAGEMGDELNYCAPKDAAFNSWLAAFVEKRGEKADASRFITTNGVSHGLDLAMRSLVGRKRVVCVESPTYFLAAHIFADHESEIVTVGVDEHGLLVDELEKGLRKTEGGIDALYLIPRHGNPSGTTLSAVRRQQLAALAREYNFWILADETYDLLDWTPSEVRPNRLAHYFDQPDDKFVGLNSFSKILAAPGLRLGWIEAPTRVIDQLSKLGVLRSGGNYAPFVSKLISRLDVHTHLDGLISQYQKNVTAIVQELNAQDPDHSFLSLIADPPTGGYFIWLRLAPGIHPDILLDAAQHDVSFLPDYRCYPAGSSPLFRTSHNEPEQNSSHFIRICFALNTEESIRQGIRSLITHIRTLLLK